jgi:hypothetical protein
MRQPTTNHEWYHYLSEVMLQLDTLTGVERTVLTKYGVVRIDAPRVNDVPRVKKYMDKIRRALNRLEQKPEDLARNDLQEYVKGVREPLQRLMAFLIGDMIQGSPLAKGGSLKPRPELVHCIREGDQ